MDDKHFSKDELHLMESLRQAIREKFESDFENTARKGLVVVGNGHWSLGYDSVKAAEAALETPPN